MRTHPHRPWTLIAGPGQVFAPFPCALKTCLLRITLQELPVPVSPAALPSQEVLALALGLAQVAVQLQLQLLPQEKELAVAHPTLCWS